MPFDSTTDRQIVSKKVEPAKSWRMLQRWRTLTLSLFVLLLFAGAANAQSGNCDELKKRVDDARTAYQTALMESRSIQTDVASNQSRLSTLENELIANQRLNAQAEKDLMDVRRDQANCKRDPSALPGTGCARVAQEILSDEKLIATAAANTSRVQAHLATIQKALANAKASLSAASSNVTNAQQELNAAAQAYAAAGCANEK